MAEILVAGKILKTIYDILEIKDEIVANKNRSKRLIERISNLQPAIDSIGNNNRTASIDLINAILKTIQDCHEYLSKFRRKMWITKIFFRKEI